MNAVFAKTCVVVVCVQAVTVVVYDEGAEDIESVYSYVDTTGSTGSTAPSVPEKGKILTSVFV